MTKRLLALGGLAILIVVLNHAAGYGQIALFLWTDSYLSVSVPYWDALGSVSHYVLLVTRSIGVFTVPAFLFISGFFSAYLARGGLSRSHQLKAVFRRVISLAIPYTFWSLVLFLLDGLQGAVYEPLEYVTKLITGGAFGHLFYVPLLCSCYLLSPWIVSWARERPVLLLLASALLHVAPLLVRYLDRFGVGTPVSVGMRRLTPDWFLTWWVVFFVLGAVAAVNTHMFRDFLGNHRWQILAVTVVFWVWNLLEGDSLLQTGRTAWMAGVGTASFVSFAISVLACFLAFADTPILGSRALNDFGKHSYGIYLVHLPLIDLIARVIRRLAPWMLAYQIVLVPFLFVFGFGIPILAMKAMGKAPRARKLYRYVFG